MAACALLVLCAVVLPLQAAAFFRGTSDTSLLDTPYEETGPTTNLTSSMVVGQGLIMNSVFYASYISAENGHDYFSIACHCAQGPDFLYTYVSLLDLNTTQYKGVNNFIAGTMPNKTFHIGGGDLTLSSTAPDIISEVQVDSTVPDATFNLTVSSEGPGLYYGGSGAFYWGGGLNNQWAAPNGYVTGTITVNGTKTKVIPQESRTWLDRQWGTGIAYNGWQWYNVMLDNGMNLGVWHSHPINGTTEFSSFVTVQFPNGHQEIHVLSNNTHLGGEFISKDTGLTWYTFSQLHIPTMNAVLNAKILHQAGEMTADPATVPDKALPRKAYTLFEGYTVLWNCWRGESIRVRSH